MGTKSGHGKGCDNRTESVWNSTAKGYGMGTENVYAPIHSYTM